MPTLAQCPIYYGRMRCDAILLRRVSQIHRALLAIRTYIPNNDGHGCPANTCLVVDDTADVGYEKGEQGIALFLSQTDDAARDFGIMC